MTQYAQMIRQLKTPRVMMRLTHLYGQRDGMLVSQTTRYTCLLKKHEELVGADGDVLLVSAPGRSEIGGNHTDHNKGKVLAAAVNLDSLCAVSKRSDMQACVYSDGYEPFKVDLSDLDARTAEHGTSVSLVRGVAARMKALGFEIGGFDAVVNSTVFSGSGLSSSAAFEVMLCAALDGLYNGFSIDAETRAQIAQYAENEYFGKPSGLLDQMASSVGGLTYIDFKDDKAVVKPLAYDFAAKGMSLVVVSTGGSHDDLTAEYASIPVEMKKVAAYFGEKVLRRVRPDQFQQAIPQLRQQAGDRAILRAAHYFAENDRVCDEVEALKKDDIATFLRLVIESGRSSYMLLQNVYCKPDSQELSLALMLAQKQLEGKGAWRVHGGGFAGTTLNFVPTAELKPFVKRMEAVFGAHSCTVLDIRPEGATCLDLSKEI